MKALSVRRVVLPFVAFACALYVPRLLFPGAAIYRGLLSAPRFTVVDWTLQLACLVVGASYGLRAAARLERGNAARLPWLLLGLCLTAFAVGHLGLMYYSLVARTALPLPSIADAGFFLGFALMIAGAARFIVVYRGSGLPIGTAREHLGLAIAAAVIFAVAGYPLLAPIARADVPRVERIINLAYPVLDFVVLVPTLVLLRITRAFRPGKVWTVWAALLVGFAFTVAGDVAFAYFSSRAMPALEPLVGLMFVLGYFFCACGTKLQYELLTD